VPVCHVERMCYLPGRREASLRKEGSLSSLSVDASGGLSNGIASGRTKFPGAVIDTPTALAPKS
jgi:hypothetical protein